MTDFGAGIALSQDWDFEVDATGDIETVSGEEELQKDVAFNVARRVRDVIGRRLDSATSKRIQIAVQSVLIDEVRIDEVQAVNVRQTSRHDTFEVVASAIASDDEIELVFTVEP